MELPLFDLVVPETGASPVSRHASHLGAVHAADGAASQMMRVYEQIPDQAGRVSDHDLVALTGLRLNIVNARTGALRKVHWIVREGLKLGPHGIRNSCWRRTTEAERDLWKRRQADFGAGTNDAAAG